MGEWSTTNCIFSVTAPEPPESPWGPLSCGFFFPRPPGYGAVEAIRCRIESSPEASIDYANPSASIKPCRLVT